MKDFTIFNQLTAMPKRLAMLLTVLFTLGVGSMLGETLTITGSASGISATDGTQSITVDGIQFGGKFKQYSTTALWFTSGSGYIYNKTSLGTINSITINYKSGGSASAKQYFSSGTSAINTYKSGTAQITTSSGGNSGTYSTFSGGFFNISISNKNLQATSIVIDYTPAAASCDKKVTINKGPETNGKFTLDKSGEQETCDGLTILVTPVPNDHYSVGNVTATTPTTGGTPTIKDNGDDTWSVTYAANSTGSSTINVTFKESPRATITLSEAGSTRNPSGTFYVGDSYTLPSTTTATCGDKTFVGWSTVTIDNPAAKPKTNFYEPEASFTLGASNTFYAVFAESGGTGSTSWEKTDISDIEASDEVVITMSSSTTMWALSSKNEASSAPPADVFTNSTFNNTIAKEYLWNIFNDNGSLTIYPNGSTTTWLYCTNTNNGVRVGTNANKAFTISGDYLKNTATSRYVGIYNSQDWRCYTNTTGNIANQTLAFYKKTTTGGYQNYTTSCITETANCSLLKFTTDITGDYTATYRQKAPATELTVAAEYDNGSSGVTYQWYSNATNSITNGTPISGATSASYTPLTTTTGTTCYYCVATYDEECTITSNVATVTIIAPVPTFTVTFDSDGGSAVASQTIEEGNKAIKPEDPTKNGYEFAGWYNGNTEFDFSTSITGDLTLKAKWNIITYNIEYTGLEGATHSNPATYTIETATITFTAPSNRDGYVFKGWTPASIAKGSTGDKTVTAQWTPIYTITWLANGQNHHTQSAEEGTELAIPSVPTAATYACNDKVFVGWTETPIVNSTNTKPADLFTSKSGTLTANKTYYAVFATAEGTPSTDYAKITTVNDLTDGNYVIAYSYDNGTQVVLKNTTKNTTQMNGTNLSLSSGIYANPADDYIWQLTKQADGSYYIYNSSASKYLSATTSALQLSDDPTKYTISYDSSNSRWTVVLKDNSTYYMHGYVSGSSYDFRVSTSGSGNKYRIYLYKNTSTITYSEYVTTCVEIPDPVISFVTTPADPIVFDPVNCGSNSTKAQAKTVQVNGENLQDHVTVEVTGPYKIARTSSTNLSDYTTSLTLDKTNTGTINANYCTIYIISCPPAQSTDATTGTLTFTTKKGNTLTVNLSTPTVNCTTYALTFNDRGDKTVENYYAGVEVPQPADPTGVCTEPIHYVFDGWAEATVANGSTEYTKVTFPYKMPGQDKTLYAVYRYLTSGGNGDYNLVTSALDDWSGDYLIAYSDQIFANGKIGGKEGIGAAGEKVDLSSYITNNTIPAAEGDKYKVSLEAINGGYLLKTQDGQYNYQSSNTNGLEVTTNKNTATNYKLSVNFVSSEEINLCLSGNAEGAIFQYNTDQQGYFRFYKNGGQAAVYLYKKASGTTLYTSAPVCGPLVEITSDKDIYVTGGKGVHSTVVAQKKITFAATRLKPSAGGAAPSIKVPAADITLNGSKTDKVKIVDITQNIVLQDDGITYAGTGEITVSYTPTASNIYEDINVQLRAEHNTGSDVILDAFTVHARSLPEEFVIVAKSGDKWYALNGDMSNGSSANPANGQVVLDDDTEPTKATYAPCNTIYTFDGLPNTGDRKFVRFQGTDGAWLWAASGTNVGIQNKSLATTPAGDNAPYNWEIETENNITYFFHNANSSRVLRLNDGKFGMYVGGTDVIRILPYEAKCLYNYAPSNLKVSELKSTYVTLVWDAVANATKYQYRTDTTNWTDAGSEPTVTINNLTAGTSYTYYIRAYHEDAGVSQECFDYSELTFTTADCDDVPTDITYTADLNSITVSWTASATTATVKLYSDEAGTTTVQTHDSERSPYKFTGLTKNTTYYVQILAGGTCASPIVPVKTEDVKVDIVEWLTDGIIVDINTNETVGVTLENEVSYGSGTGSEATELFFSKYYEATTNVKLVAIYNGTKNLIDLTDYQIHYGKDSWESQYITLKDFGETKGQIQPGEELILYTMSDSDNSDKQIMNCVNAQYPDGKWVRVTQSNNEGKGHLAFAGDKTIVLKKAGTIVDIIGALDSTGKPTTANAKTKPSWGDANGWTCATGLSIADDTEIGISTNRCLLIRNNTVTSGENAVTSNINDFVTLCSEWKGAQVPDNDTDNGVAASCENFAYVGTFDYSDYYTKFESMGEGTTFEENDRNLDGTVTIPITDLYKQSCRNIRVKLSNADGDVLTDREYKVPIMITTTQGTDGQTFIDLQQNLAMIETDGEGNVVDTHPLSLDEVREICKTCDVVVRDNATLMKMEDDAANDHPQVRDIYVYENSSLVVPNGTNYTINNLSLRRKGDDVASLNVYPGALKLPESTAAPISLDFRLSAESWHWFTLPYDCNISEVTWVDGSPAQYNVDWFLMTYDGEKRAATQAGGCWKAFTGTTIKAGEGFIIAINGNINNPAHTYELRFPMSKDVLVAEGTDKTVDVRAWGVETNIRPNHKGWNLVGNPYLAYYQRNNITNFEGLRLGQLVGPDPQTGYWEQTGEVPYVVVPVGAGWVAYEQVLASDIDLLPFTAYFVQVGNDGKHESDDELSIAFDHTKLQLSATPMPASIIQRSASVVEEPVIVGVSLTNAKGESDKTSLIIDDQYTDEYEMNADFFKWFGDYYKYYTKPVLYTIGADDGKRAFNAISEELATQPISLGMYAAQAGNYTFSLDLRSDLSKVQEVWLYDATQDTYTNLLQDSYTFQTAKTESAGRFFLSVKMAPKVSTEMDNVTDGTVWATTQDHTIVVNGLLSDAQLWIYDATGKLLHTDHTLYYQHSYSVPQSGTYFVRVQNTMQTQTIKVVVE